ncbi:hypothetical protein QBC42DRAFT_90984 [Cladorrhinum samala]|uniref:C2H2-type domain-containing protein n=1 Tax=Cladorrhinum samala TaxID=585594 RepID=A0AAV9I5J4_9PEZI|nr:hypothetical protein QBC42DRAFT_90984 [Cladorrhinum samala]
MSMPSDQMSLSTVTDSTTSDHLSVQPSTVNVRAEPINDIDRHALKRMAMADKPNPADFDAIIHGLLQFDLGDEEVERLMTQISAFDPNIAHIREREFLTALDRVNDDVPDVGLNSLAQPRPERLEPVTMAETLRAPTSPKLDLDMDSQYHQQDQPRVDVAHERPSKFPSTAVLPSGSSRADEINSRPTSTSSADIQEQPNSPQPVACPQAATTLSSQEDNSRLPNDFKYPILDDEIKVVSSEPATLESGSRAPPEQVALLSQEYSAGPGWVQESDDESDHQSLSSGCFSEDYITDIGNYAAKQVFGDDFENSISRSVLDEAVQCFIDVLMLGRIDSRPHSVGLSDGNQAQSGSSSTTHSGFGEASSLKRKAAGHNAFRQGYRGTQRDDNDDGDDDDIGRRQNRRGNGGDRSTGETGNESGRSSADRLEFMCPFRLKDRFRFNVRDWHECATKAYICEGKKNELNELRRHLQTKHARPGAPSDPYCSRCKAEFATVALLDEHAKEECTYRELFISDDPLDGLTADAIRVLTNRKGRQGRSPVAQYQEICHIALGKDFEAPGPGGGNRYSCLTCSIVLANGNLLIQDISLSLSILSYINSILTVYQRYDTLFSKPFRSILFKNSIA